MRHRPGPDPAAVELAIRELLRVTGEDLSKLADADRQKMMAAAAFARGRVLLAAACELVEGGREEVAGILVRSLVETCITGLYVLWGGDEAWRVLFGNHWYQLAKLPLTTVQVPEDAEKLRPNFSDMVDALRRIMVERGHADAAQTIREYYDGLYRSESFRNVHGGLGTVIGYLDTSKEPFAVRPLREEPYRAMDLLALAEQMLAYLADALYEAFGLPGDRLDVARLNYPLTDPGSSPP